MHAEGLRPGARQGDLADGGGRRSSPRASSAPRGRPEARRGRGRWRREETTITSVPPRFRAARSATRRSPASRFQRPGAALDEEGRADLDDEATELVEDGECSRGWTRPGRDGKGQYQRVPSWRNRGGYAAKRYTTSAAALADRCLQEAAPRRSAWRRYCSDIAQADPVTMRSRVRRRVGRAGETLPGQAKIISANKGLRSRGVWRVSPDAASPVPVAPIRRAVAPPQSSFRERSLQKRRLIATSSEDGLAFAVLVFTAPRRSPGLPTA